MENNNKPITITQVIASKYAQQLLENMHLTASAKASLTSNMIKIADDPKLAQCDKYSIFKYCIAVYSLGLSGVDKVYAVPYRDSKTGKTYAQLQVGYKGFRELALRTNKYASINCTIVYDCDKIYRNRFTGTVEVEFETDFKKCENAKKIGYFAYALDKQTHQIVDSEFMSIEQIEKHATKYSKAYTDNKNYTPWKSEPDAMAMKTVLKKLCKRLDTSEEMQNLVENDQLVFGGANENNVYADNPQNKKSFQEANVKDFEEDEEELEVEIEQ